MIVNDIVTRVAKELIDTHMVRWQREDLIAYLADGVSAIAAKRPALFSHRVVSLMVDHSPVRLPDDAFLLLSVDSVDGAAVQYVLMDKLNQINPYWRQEKGIPSCWTRHDNEVLNFWLYPNPIDPVSLSFQYAKTPVITVDTERVELPTLFFGALVDFMLYRAFSRDSENPSEAAKAQFHFQSFALFMNDDQALKGEKDQRLLQSTVN
ncbi:hypothetical protein IHC87_17395 [Photobacterium damselae subsp. damselae]|uniref:phage adaptor protein n=1 Tax=Photobacterium damselae TaxID=38293 RepID=UPI001F1F5539|nr:DUF6682 family protein [Photobacterium damselae]UJZ96343.1 hypothetical protein IHC87_17395 [Photobacterium damselae subsp. damselae]UJZ99752.1 hypothetical protein IHC88_20095 [Photobacterium damselae subsp. damselae]UKA12676.1 hypothetical protein IHC91_17365 [Photobacterium damselae subsp. damselae]